jgi:hypothetical protein
MFLYLDSVLRFGYPATAKQLAVLRGVPMEIHCRWPVNLPDEAVKALTVWWEATGGAL